MADRIAVLADGRVQQVASPQDLYRRPANLFVADFVGTSNRIPGRLEDGRLVSPELGTLPAGGATAPLGDCHLVVRPEEVRLATGDDAPGALRGRVADVQFKGGSSHVAVDVPGLDRPFLVSVAGVSTVGRGDAVSLDWDTAVVVRDELL